MIKLKYLVAGILVSVFINTLPAQELIKNSKVTGLCYAGNKVNRIYIPPPEKFLKSTGVKGGGSITVYYSGFTSQAKSAFEYAVSILKSMLPADTKITISASLEKITTSGVLASSSITEYFAGYAINAQNPMAYYPVALAEKIAGKSLNSNLQPDIQLTVNSSINWYFGTDGKTPVQKYDMVTVVLHEICHGLGFYDAMNTDSTVGWYDIGSMPMIYDTFVENLEGKNLTDTLQFPNYSSALKSQLIGGNLYFNGPLLRNYTNGGRARLYAPPVWNSGSSVSHLDESATLQVNSLMTPFIDFGEAIHDPGKYTFSILGDLGWINTRIIHSPPSDTEKHLSDLLLSVRINSDTIYNHNKIGAVYSFDDFKSSDTLLLNSPGNDNNYIIRVNVPSYNSELQYYFFTEDTFLRLYRSPSLFKNTRYSVRIGTDSIKPVISHKPSKYYLETIDSLKFEAIVTDNLGVDSVYVEYKVNTGPSMYIGLKTGLAGRFKNLISARPLSLKGGDSLKYRIYAIDSAKIPNIAVLPASGYFATKIEAISAVVTSYSTDFSNPGNDFFNVGFYITRPDGFNTFSLNTKHPYESPEVSGDSIEYTSMLRHPVKFDESGMLISYNEVVLVEPGEPGSVYGSPDFYDYVIVEGSKNSGKSWFSIADGYDSRFNSTWENAYNSNIDIYGNSLVTGDESMIMKHTIYCRSSARISVGDTILIRFRLYSDPFANGWGWLIDDLKVNPLIDGVEKIMTGSVIIFPNPGKGIINIGNEGFGGLTYKPVRFSIFNSSGVCILNGLYPGDSGTLADISEYPSGLYFIILHYETGIKTIKYCLVK